MLVVCVDSRSAVRETSVGNTLRNVGICMQALRSVKLT